MLRNRSKDVGAVLHAPSSMLSPCQGDLAAAAIGDRDSAAEHPSSVRDALDKVALAYKAADG